MRLLTSKSTAAAIVLGATLATTLPARAAQEASHPEPKAPVVAPDTDGEAVDFDVVYKADVMRINVKNGENKTVSLGNVDARVTVDGERAFNLPGSTFFLYLLNNHGGKPNENAGTAQGLDNIEVSTATTKIYQAWYQQNFSEDRVSILFGLYDLNSEFYVTDASAIFINPSFGIGPDFSQSGANGPSIFPTTSLGVRFKYQFTPDLEWILTALDGVPGDPNNARGTHVKLDSDDGWLVATEVDANVGKGKVGLGYWRYTKKVSDLTDALIQHSNNGFYFLAEQQLTQAEAEPEQGLKAFLRYGIANADVNAIERALEIGVSYQGLIPGRGDDVVGLGYAQANYSSKSQDPSSPDYESIVELSYRAKVAEWLVVQPDLQYVTDHGGATSMRTTLLGVRVELSWQ